MMRETKKIEMSNAVRICSKFLFSKEVRLPLPGTTGVISGQASGCCVPAGEQRLDARAMSSVAVRPPLCASAGDGGWMDGWGCSYSLPESQGSKTPFGKRKLLAEQELRKGDRISPVHH